MPITLINSLAAALAIAAFLPAAVLCAQTMLALWPRKDTFRDIADSNPETVVLIPAHNEGSRIRRTLRSVLKSGEDHVRILVVADNCSDHTAAVARAAGAEVIERRHKTRLGKAYALGFGVQHLRHAPPDAIVVIDADAAMGGAGAGRLATLATTLNRPVQALNVIDRQHAGDSHSTIAALGNRLHNVVRPLGNARLKLPCLLTGSGTAFPWKAIDQVGLENDHLAEDKQLGIDMALAGYPPIFCLETKVASYLTADYQGYVGQRTRWEHGHLLSAVQQIPRLIMAAVRQRNWPLLAIAVDLAVPPMALICCVWCSACAASLVALAVGGAAWPLAVTLAASGLLLVALGATWFAFARRRVPWISLLGLPWYVFKKLPIYIGLLCRGPQQVWLRANRSTAE